MAVGQVIHASITVANPGDLPQVATVQGMGIVPDYDGSNNVAVVETL